jgi:four helix bundle protein
MEQSLDESRDTIPGLVNSIQPVLGVDWRDDETRIVNRSAVLADRVIQVVLALPNSPAGFELGKQLIRCGTSIGANVEEAQAGESKADFVHKLRIARKECRETAYFLHRVRNAALVKPQRLDELIDESGQLLRILTAIIKSASAPKGESGLTVRKS